MEVVGHDRLKVCYHGLKRVLVATLAEVSVKITKTYMKSLTADLALSILTKASCDYQVVVRGG